MKLYFPNLYDLKYIMKDIPGLKDVGLAKLSYEIGVIYQLLSVVASDHNIKQVQTVYLPLLATSKCYKKMTSLDKYSFHPVSTSSSALD